MSNLTKEWLLKTIAELEEERDATPGAVNEDAAKALAAMKRALASLEAEPDYTRYDCGCCGHETLTAQHKNICPVCNHSPMAETPLYTAPPAPVSVPDEATPENIEILASTYAPSGITYQWDRDECNAAADSWNACCAMLQGVDGNSPVIGIDMASEPDRSVEVRYLAPPGYVMVPVEPTLDMVKAGAKAAKEGWLIPGVYRAMLEAATPKQEVKGE